MADSHCIGRATMTARQTAGSCLFAAYHGAIPSKRGIVWRRFGMQDSILRTKLKRPRVAPDIVPRTRLLARLQEGRQRTLTLISAPAGYGKSTLASRWVAGCDSPSAWVSLDESDSDLRTFLSYFLVSVRSLFPKIELRTEALLEASPLPPVPVLARHLLNDLDEISEPFILVLDDYHHIHDTSVHDLLAEFLAHPPEAMHVVLLTRHDPPLPIARLRGRGQVSEIRAADLRFSVAEAATFLNRLLKIPVDDATIAILEKKTEGWVTGLRLAGLYLSDGKDLNQRVQELSGSSRQIAEYLFSEVLSRQNPDIAAFIVETAILDRFCAPLCQELHAGGDDGHDFDARRFIQWLIDSNVFVIPLDDQGYWFRYHHLFQEFRQALLRKRETSDTIARLHIHASNWFAENDLIDEAIRHALAAGETKAAARLVVDHRHDLMNSAQFQRLSSWLKSLPEEAESNSPLLVSTRAFAGIELGRDDDILASTDRAWRLLTQLPPDSADHAALESEVNVLQGFIKAAFGNSDRSLALAEKALTSDALPADALLIRSLGVFSLALSHQMLGRTEQAVDLFQRELSNHVWPANLLARMHFYQAVIHYLDGNLLRAMTFSDHCLRSLPDRSFTHTSTFAHYLLGAAHYWRNHATRAEHHLYRVLDDHRAANPSYFANAGFVLACLHIARDGGTRAEQLLSHVVFQLQEIGHSTMTAMARAFRVELMLRLGDINRARELSRDVDFDIRPPLWFFYVPQLTPLKLLLAEGTDESLKQAHARLVEMDKGMRRIKRKSVRLDLLALLALACHKSGKKTAALGHLEAALTLAEPGGWIRNFVDLGDPMTDLLERLNQVHPGHSYAQQVLGACRAEPRRSSSAESNGNETPPLFGQAAGGILTERELEILPLLADGLRNAEIAARLFVSSLTVKTHLQNLYRKLNARSRIEALRNARELGLIVGD